MATALCLTTPRMLAFDNDHESKVRRPHNPMRHRDGCPLRDSLFRNSRVALSRLGLQPYRGPCLVAPKFLTLSQERKGFNEERKGFDKERKQWIKETKQYIRRTAELEVSEIANLHSFQI